MSEIFETQVQNLNPQQREAVETLEGPVMVIAGPGSGKTQVLTLRIANILKTTDAGPDNVLCLTFTESGVSAMKERLTRFIGTTAYKVNIFTFHGFCNEVIQTFPDKFAFKKDLKQLDDLSKVKVLRQVLEELEIEYNGEVKADLLLRPFNNKYKYQNLALSLIQTLKREGITVDQLKNYAKDNLSFLEQNPDINPKTGKPKDAYLKQLKNNQKLYELAHIYQQYNAQLFENGFYDYEDMILFVIDKLENDEELLAYYQEKYLYMLVDEYQDTNGAQNKILKLLGSFDPSPNIFVVGDDDQAIYRFQGANLDNLLFFTKQFANVKIVTLTNNYRSSQTILDAASSLVSKNQNRIVNFIKGVEKKLVAKSNIQNKDLKIYEFNSFEYENRFIVKKINELIKNGASYKDIAVFYRRHSDAEDLVDEMIKSKIPIKLSAGSNVLDEQIIQKFLNLLRAIFYRDKEREFVLYQVLSYEFVGLTRLDVFKVTRFAHDKRMSIIDVISNNDKLLEAGVNHPEDFVTFFTKILNWQILSTNSVFTDFIEHVAQESGFLDFVFSGVVKTAEGIVKKQINAEAINSYCTFYNYIKNLNLQNKELTLQDFLNDIILLKENSINISEKELDLQKESVHMMTAHAAKGLEFKYVFLIKFYDKNWGGKVGRDEIKLPSELLLTSVGELDNKKDLEMEDERRLAYVALTRAKEEIFISYAKKYPSGNSTKEVTPSQFLFEIDNNFIEKQSVAKYEEMDIEYLKMVLSPKVEYSISEKDYLQHLIKNFKLSATSLNQYVKCPLEFKYECLIKVPRVKDLNLCLGSAVHFALDKFFKNLKQNPDTDYTFLISMFQFSLDKELLSPDDYKEIYAKGESLLKGYYDGNKDRFKTPVDTEYNFDRKGIVLELGDTAPIQLTGSIDKIEYLDEAAGLVRLIDYKTSEPKTRNEILGNTKSSDGAIHRQLTFYKLLTDLDDSFRPKSTSSKFQVEEAVVDFIKPTKKGDFKQEVFNITSDDIQNLKDKINVVIKRIRDLDFYGTDDFPRCGECEYCEMLKL